MTPPDRLELAEARHLWDPEPGWLNTASYGLPPRTAVADLHAVLDDWRTGRTDWAPWDTAVGRARAAFARLVGAPVTDIAIGAAVSQLLATVAASLPPGSRVLAPAEEFTSNLFPWQVSARLRTAPLDRLADHITSAVDVVAFSLVQSATGRIAPVADILTAARDAGALVVVDATQACGWLPVDATRFDVLACAAYKWLMAPRGAAFCYLAPAARERLRPIAAGWYAGADADAYYGLPMRLAGGARAFDLSPAWFSYVGAAPALEVLERIGVAAVHRHDTALARRFLTGLGLPVPEAGQASAIVTVEAPGAAERLRAAGIRAAVRAGRVRASFHLYTTEADVDRAVEALS